MNANCRSPVPHSTMNLWRNGGKFDDPVSRFDPRTFKVLARSANTGILPGQFFERWNVLFIVELATKETNWNYGSYLGSISIPQHCRQSWSAFRLSGTTAHGYNRCLPPLRSEWSATNFSCIWNWSQCHIWPTLWSRVLLQKLTFARLVKKSSTSYAIRWFITVFTRSH
jgi:hypothetical protein